MNKLTTAIIILAVLIGGYLYSRSKTSVEVPNLDDIDVATTTGDVVDNSTSTEEIDVSDLENVEWNTYSNEEHGILFEYPGYLKVIRERDSHPPSFGISLGNPDLELIFAVDRDQGGQGGGIEIDKFYSLYWTNNGTFEVDSLIREEEQTDQEIKVLANSKEGHVVFAGFPAESDHDFEKDFIRIIRSLRILPLGGN